MTIARYTIAFKDMSKPDPAISNAELASLFTKIGLTKARAEEAIKSPKSAAILKEIIESNPGIASVGENKIALLPSLSVALSKSTGIDLDRRDYAVKAILDSKLTTLDQISGIFSVPRVCDPLKVLF